MTVVLQSVLTDFTSMPVFNVVGVLVLCDRGSTSNSFYYTIGVKSLLTPPLQLALDSTAILKV